MSECVSEVDGQARERRADSRQKKGTKVRVSVREKSSQAEISGFLFVRVCAVPDWVSVTAAADSYTTGRDEGERGAEESHRAE